ncbi:MAG: inorganic phosphate transporter [Burkholderiales bacterium]|nr:inorganic phosphate transporter [Burkholderiales bacterium]
MNLPLFAVLLIIIALAFEFVNGFHDTANAVATSIATKSLEPFQAIAISAIFNLIGALSGTAVALTIAKGFASPILATQPVILSALLSAITWNLLTWYFGMPSSSSHALIGGLVGAIMFQSGYAVINYTSILYKVILPMVMSPILGFAIATLIVLVVHRMLRNNTEPRKINNLIREIQVLSTAFLSFSHGANDAQKTMGILTLTLFNFHLIATPTVPQWVIFACAVCMALGTLCGGVKIIRTLSTRVAKLKPVSGLAAELSSAIILFIGSRFGMPLSTTHAVSGSIMGAGNAGGSVGVNWGVVKNMVVAWVLTFPTCMLLAGGYLYIVKLLY